MLEIILLYTHTHTHTHKHIFTKRLKIPLRDVFENLVGLQPLRPLEMFGHLDVLLMFVLNLYKTWQLYKTVS